MSNSAETFNAGKVRRTAPHSHGRSGLSHAGCAMAVVLTCTVLISTLTQCMRSTYMLAPSEVGKTCMHAMQGTTAYEHPAGTCSNPAHLQAGPYLSCRHAQTASTRLCAKGGPSHKFLKPVKGGVVRVWPTCGNLLLQHR